MLQSAVIYQSLSREWPIVITMRLGSRAPRALSTSGPLSLLSAKKIALFSSARTPGEVILRSHDFARRARDEGQTVISGFHSPIEKECLHILLRGRQPIIICPARAIEKMRIPTECRAAFDAGRILFLSPFISEPGRITRESALHRNEVVAALADQAFIPHAAPGGETARIQELLALWGTHIIGGHSVALSSGNPVEW
jgi:predicted Rossmann fold nucleotide-binding protein DprA/Smf involved in DNA uptake